MKRQISMLLLLLAACAFTFGAGGQEEADMSDEPVTLRMAIWTADEETMGKVIAAFEATHPQIKVEMENFGSSEYNQTLPVQLAGGADIDLVPMQNNASYSDLASKGALLPLGDYVSQDNLDVSGFGPLYEGAKFDGVVHALPFRTSTWVLYYNKDLFDAANEPYPSGDMTWDEYRELAERMTSGEGPEKIWGTYVHSWPIAWFGPGLQTGTTIIDEDLESIEYAIRLRDGLTEDGSAMSQAEAIASSAHYTNMFYSGRVAMHYMGEWHIGQLRGAMAEDQVDFDWDIVPIPHHPDAEPNTTWGMPATLGINSRSEKGDAAWEFVKFATGPEGAAIFAADGMLPAFSNSEISEIFVGEGGQAPENIGIVLEQQVFVEYPAVEGINAVVNTIYKEEGELVFAGEQTAEEAIENIKQRIEDEIN